MVLPRKLIGILTFFIFGGFFFIANVPDTYAAWSRQYRVNISPNPNLNAGYRLRVTGDQQGVASTVICYNGNITGATMTGTCTFPVDTASYYVNAVVLDPSSRVITNNNPGSPQLISRTTGANPTAFGFTFCNMFCTPGQNWQCGPGTGFVCNGTVITGQCRNPSNPSSTTCIAAAPTGLSYTCTAPYTARASWNAIPGTSRYSVTIWGTGDPGNVFTSSDVALGNYTIMTYPLNGGTSWNTVEWQVQSYASVVGPATRGPRISCPATPTNTPTPAPAATNLAANCPAPGTTYSFLGPGSIGRLTWNSASSSVGYTVVNTTTGATLLNRVPSASNEAYINTTAGHSYRWTVFTNFGGPTETAVNGPNFTCAPATTPVPTSGPVGAPTNVTASCTGTGSNTRVNINWNRGANSTQSRWEVNNITSGGSAISGTVNCSTSTCTASSTNSSYSGDRVQARVRSNLPSTSSYVTSTIVQCPITATNTPTSGPTATRTPTPTRTPTATPTVCVIGGTVNLSPSSSTVIPGNTRQLEAEVNGLTACGGTVQVNFSSNNTSVATVSPTSDSSARYQTTATVPAGATSGAQATIRADVLINGVVRFSDTARITVGAQSCDFDLIPASFQTGVGGTQVLQASNITQSGTIDEVVFSSDNLAVASVNPLSDTSPTYRTTVTGTGIGTASITAEMMMSGSPICSDTTDITIAGADPWWQIIDGDAISNGNIESQIPASCTAAASCTNSLITSSSAGVPGVASSGGGTIDTGTGNVSTNNWQASAGYDGPQYTYDYFENKATCGVIQNLSNDTVDNLSDLISGSESDGYYWNRYTGSSSSPLTIANDIDLGDERVILFVKNADLVVNGTITFNRGQGFFLAIVEGNIIVDPSVGGSNDNNPELEGLFFTQEQLRTGTIGIASDQQFHLRGSVAAFDQIILQRSLPNDATIPAEVFEHSADMLLMFPACLGERTVEWRELAP